MKVFVLFLAFAVAFVCGMCLEKHRALMEQYQVEYQADMAVGEQE